jgi:hypothetical protein
MKYKKWECIVCGLIYFLKMKSWGGQKMALNQGQHGMTFQRIGCVPNVALAKKILI